MQPIQHFIRLRTHFSHIPEGRQIVITQQELASFLCCTGRNVKFLLKQLVERGWIEWQPGRGRGNHSRLLFLASLDEVIVERAKHLVDKGGISEALSLFNGNQVRPPYREAFFGWLNQQFGYHLDAREEKQAETLRVSFYRPIPELDPPFVGRRTESHMVNQIFDTLVKYDAQSDSFQPHLAHYWEVNEDFTRWVFYLRKGVLFHHGREMTAHDVKWTIERLQDPAVGSPARWLFEQVEEIHIPKDTVVELQLSAPNRLLLHYMAFNRAAILPREVCEQMGSRFARLPVGTGPFRVKTNDDQLFELEAFPSYFQGRAHLDRIEVWVVPQLETGEITPGELQKDPHLRPFQQTHDDSDNWRGIDRVEIGSKFLTFNLNKPGPQQQLPFRRLINRLLDREKMVAELGGNRLFPACGFLPDESRRSDQSWQRGMPPDLIEAVLRQCGYRGETVKLYTYEGSSNEADMNWIAAQFQRYQIRVEASAFPIEQLKRPEYAMQADMILSGEVFDDDLLFGMIDTYQTKNSFLRYHWSPEIKEMVDKQVQNILNEREKADRFVRLLEIEEALKEEEAIVFLFHLRQSTAYHPSVKGVSLNKLGWANYKDIWF